MIRQRGAKTAFKRALILGTTWTAFNHLDEKHLGIREVSIVQTNSVAFKTERGNSWLEFTGDVTNPSPGCFQVYEGDRLILTYQLQLNAKVAS